MHARYCRVAKKLVFPYSAYMDSIQNTHLFSLKVLHAFEFAAVAHDGQRRKGGLEVPYISHPAAVGFILGRSGFGDDVVIAGILHDVVEDTTYDLSAIEEKFGPAVAHIVKGVTEDHALPFLERKSVYIEQIRNGSPEIKAVSAADKIANLTNVVAAEAAGEDVFKTIWKGGPEMTMDFYLRTLEAVKEGFTHPIVDAYESVLEQFLVIAKRHL